MAKSKPVGVRFRKDILDKLKEDHNIESPQQALVFMERFYVTHQELARDITQVMRKEAVTWTKNTLKSYSETISLKDLTKVETSELKPPPTTNVAINTLPKTLNELKTFCPKELTGFEKSEWISKERQKYGI